jgi:hypothetical protein
MLIANLECCISVKFMTVPYNNYTIQRDIVIVSSGIKAEERSQPNRGV